MSIWAFCRTVRKALQSESNRGVEHARPSRRLTYTFSRSTEYVNVTAPTSLPPKSHISHLAQVCDFHLNATYYCFDSAAFQEQLNRGDLSSTVSNSSIWNSKIQAILALGKLFLEKGASASGPPGIREYQQAAEALPTTIQLSQDPLAAIETLLLLSIYSQAADMHNVAYLYVSGCRTLRAISYDLSDRTSIQVRTYLCIDQIHFE